MTDGEISGYIDHTLLQAPSSWVDVKKLCDEAVLYSFASACVPPSYVLPIHREYGGDLVVCTVVGFPLGYSRSEAKRLETELALQDGAGEIDMVINVGDVKNARFDAVLEEISLLKKTCADKVLKVIVETCFLTEEEKIKVCGIVTQAGADFIKTSTGFGTAGAALADIALFKKHVGPGVKIKASGGIRTREDLFAFINAGASRIGTSSAVKMLTGA